MRTIHLHGHLKKAFGASYRFDVTTAAEAIRALHTAFPGRFVEALRDGAYQIVRGRRAGGMSLSLEEVAALKLGGADLHIIPVAKGARSGKGTAKTILGVALIGTAIFFSGGTLAAPLAGLSSAIPGAMGLTFGNVALFGLGLALTGISSLYTKADESPSDSPDGAKSYSLGGPQNTNEQGNPIALVYGGPVIVGAQPISLGFDIENLGA